MKKKIILSVFISFVIIVFIISKFLSSDDNSIPSVTTEKVHTQTITTQVSATGIVALADSNRFYSSSAATIKEIFVSEGDYVKKGQVLFNYNEKALDELKNQLASAQLNVKSNELALKSVNEEIDQSLLKEYSANITQCDTNIAAINYKLEQLDIQIKQAENHLETAKNNFDNYTLIYKSGGISLDELNEYENTYIEKTNDLELLKNQKKSEELSLNTEKANKEVAQAKYNQLVNKNNTSEIKNKRASHEVELQQSKLTVSQIQNKINSFKTSEIAPDNGVIINIQDSFKSGAAIGEGTYLFEIANENTVVNLDVPEYDMPNVALNQPVTITYDGFDGELKGKVTKIYPTAQKKTINNSEKNVVTVQITISDKTNLKLGFNVNGKITTNVNENAIVIPVSSYLTDNTGKDYVYIVNNKNIVEKKFITIKNFDNMNIEVGGLNLGENVISSPDESAISEGMTVNISEATGND